MLERLSITWRAPRVTVWTFAGLVLLGLACGDGRPESSSGDVGGTDAGRPSDTGQPSDDGGLRSDADAAGADAGSPLTIVHEPDTTCSPPGGTVQVVYPATPSPISFDTLGKIGARRFAAGRDEQGFVLFDAEGTNASAAPIQLAPKDRVMTSGTTLGVFGRNSGLSYQRFDAQGLPIGVPVEVSNDVAATRQALGRGGSAGEGALLLWATPTDLVSAAVDGQGAVSLPDSFESQYPNGAFVGAVAFDGTNYAVAYNLRDEQSRYRTSFAFATQAGVVGARSMLHVSFTVHTLVGIARVGGGFAVLINITEPVNAPLLVMLDGTGKPLGSARILDGSVVAFGMAAQGTELGLVAQRSDHRIEFRPFSTDGTPLGPWVCLDSAGSPNLDWSAAIDSDGQGYAVLYRAADGAQALRRFDRLGTGP